jgi:hypothetical protein
MKRGSSKKPKVVFPNADANVSSLSDDENIVLNLKVTPLHTAPSTLSPDAYDDHDSFLSKPLDLETDSQSHPVPSEPINLLQSVPDTTNRVVELLKDFEEKNKQNEWPSTTSIHCYWCCQKFPSVPFGIPVKYNGNKFHVYGCFCSLECAAAYNLKNYDSIDEMWERYMLINMLSRRIGHKDQVIPAPSRLALKEFGGYMDINEFRRFTDSKKLISVNFPPMMTLTQQIEEINGSDLTNDYKYIPIDTDRINKYKEKIKLKRSKPIANYKNTLDHTMNLKITS